MANLPSPPPPSPPSPPMVPPPIVCTNDCADQRWMSDGNCDDGGDGAEYSSCTLGEDCADCGYRIAPSPPPNPPPPPPSYSPYPPPSIPPHMPPAPSGPPLLPPSSPPAPNISPETLIAIGCAALLVCVCLCGGIAIFSFYANKLKKARARARAKARARALAKVTALHAFQIGRMSREQAATIIQSGCRGAIDRKKVAVRRTSPEVSPPTTRLPLMLVPPAKVAPLPPVKWGHQRVHGSDNEMASGRPDFSGVIVAARLLALRRSLGIHAPDRPERQDSPKAKRNPV